MGENNGFTKRGRGRQAFAAMSLGGKSIPTDVTFAIAAGATTVTEVTIQVVDIDDQPISGVRELTVFLSDAATGVGLTAIVASGTVQAKAASGTDLGVLTAKKALKVNTLADGSYVLEITDLAKTPFYVAANVPALGLAEVSRILVTADYGV